ncbi:MAG: flagellar motor switch protein FliG, partial [Rhodospirillaceae bacterium]|nr:flagellar motor switch protein FliG [Rhodospirillaceae bacterium]
MARVKDDYRSLAGRQKAAIFMLAVGQKHSAQLFEKMDDEEIRELSQAMASLGSINASVIERLFVEFADQLSSAGGLVGSVSSTERLLMGALPEDRVSQIMEEM